MLSMPHLKEVEDELHFLFVCPEYTHATMKGYN
jgi:hypothetical protein